MAIEPSVDLLMMRRLFLIFLSCFAVADAESSLEGKVFCGYQGWFRCEGDGSDNGWFHYASGGKFEPGHAGIEIWPDMTELGAGEKFATPFRHADGEVAEVFSSTKEATVLRHFRWMRDYGIDGAFVQRFATTARDPRFRRSMDQVLTHCIKGANMEQRKWALMYDLSGLRKEHFSSIEEDWKQLRSDGPMGGKDEAYLTHRGKPLIAMWGLGFSDRDPALAEWERLIRFFKEEGYSVMLGVPCYWRTLDRDAIADPKLHELIRLADIVSPWAVGRFGTSDDAARRVDTLLRPDIAWCREVGLDYLPVAFPGFSWQNMEKGRGREAKFDAIPRRGGRFLWSQAVAAKQAGAKSIYIAMFDEMDEATAIFKTTQTPPVGESRFLSEVNLPSDHYLWLSGEIGNLLGRKSLFYEFPERPSEESSE